MAEANVKTIYRDDIEAAIKSLRAGEGLHVFSLRGLASSRKGIDAVLDVIHDKGAHAIDVTTNRRSDGRYGFKLLSEAVASLSSERQGGHKGAQKNGRAGGLASGKRKAEGRMPWPNIEKLWYTKSLFRDELMERINESGYKPISYSTIHKHLGPRGVKLGRRASEQ